MASRTASRRSFAALALVGALVALGSRTAHAEGSALAQSLFDRARALMDEGKFAEACPLLAESQRLDPGGGTQLNLAVCWEGAARLATANEGFHEALGQAIRDGRADRKAIAEEHIAAIAPRLSTLAVEVPTTSRVPGLSVFVDGTELGSVAWGIPAAVDGGAHRIDATAPGRRSWTSTVQVSSEGDRTRIAVPELPPTDGAPTTGVSGARDDRVCPPGMRVAGDTCERLPEHETHFSTATWVTGGVGLGLVAFGLAAGGIALVQDGKASDAASRVGCNETRSYCPDGSELDSAETLASEAETWGWVSTGMIGAGATTVLVALLLPRERDESAPRATASVGPGGAFVSVLVPVR